MKNYVKSFDTFLNEKKITLSDVSSIEWCGTEYNGRENDRLYRFYVRDKKGKQIMDIRSMDDFNKVLGTDFEASKGYDKFEEEIKKLAPHIKVELGYYDVS